MKILLRVSLLAAILLLALTIALPGWWDPANQQIIWDYWSEMWMSNDELRVREEARRRGVPYGEYVAEISDSRAKTELKSEALEKTLAAIQRKDADELARALEKLSASDLPTDIYVKAIRSGFPEALPILHNNGLPCYPTAESTPSTPAFGPTDMRIRSAQSLTYRAAIAHQDSAYFRHWMVQGCWRNAATKNIRNPAHDIVRLRLMPFADVIPTTPEFDEFWKSALLEAITQDAPNFALELLRKPHFVRLLDARSAAEKNSFLVALQSRQFDVALGMLKVNSRILAERAISIKVYDYVADNALPPDLLLAIAGAPLVLPASFQPYQEMVNALESGNIAVATFWLKHDPQLRLEGVQDRYNDRIDTLLRKSDVEYVPLWLHRGLGISRFDEHGLDQFVDAMAIGHIAVIDQLIVAGIPLNRDYQGRSLLDMPIGGDADTRKRIRKRLAAGTANHARRESTTLH